MWVVTNRFAAYYIAIQATWGVISRRKTLLGLSQSFGTLAEREEEGKEPGLTSKPGINRHHSCASRSEQSAAIGKGDGLNNLYLIQNFSPCQRLQF